MKYIEATENQGKAFYLEFLNKGKIVMLNLLKYKEVADYSTCPELSPGHEITGKNAYTLYMEATLPLLEKAGSKVLFFGSSSNYMIGPESEKWDAVLLVEHQSVTSFMAFASDAEYLKTAGHRTASLEDSRLLPSKAVEIN